MLQLRTAGAELAAERELVELLRKSETDLVEGYEAQVLAKTEQEEALQAEVIETKLAEMHAEHLHREEEMDARLADVQAMEASLQEAQAQCQLQMQQTQAALVAKDLELQGLQVKVTEKDDERAAAEAFFRHELQRERERSKSEMDRALASMDAREEDYTAECSSLREQLQTQVKETNKVLESAQEEVRKALRDREAEQQKAEAAAVHLGHHQSSDTASSISIVARRLAAAAAAGGSRPLPPRLPAVHSVDPIEARRQLRERLGLPPPSSLAAET